MGGEFKISEETARSLLESRGYKVEKVLPQIERKLITKSTNALAKVVGLEEGGCSWGVRATLLIDGYNKFSVKDIHELRDWLLDLIIDMEKHNDR